MTAAAVFAALLPATSEAMRFRWSIDDSGAFAGTTGPQDSNLSMRLTVDGIGGFVAFDQTHVSYFSPLAIGEVEGPAGTPHPGFETGGYGDIDKVAGSLVFDADSGTSPGLGFLSTGFDGSYVSYTSLVAGGEPTCVVNGFAEIECARSNSPVRLMLSGDGALGTSFAVDLTSIT